MAAFEGVDAQLAEFDGVDAPTRPGSPAPPDAREVTRACLAALRLLEQTNDRDARALRERYPSTGGLAAAFYDALSALHARARRG